MAPEETSHDRRLLPILKEAWERYLLKNFEWVFILALLVTIPVISLFFDDKLAFIDFYFLPVLLAGYFLNARSAVLGGVLSLLTVLFFVILQPESFYAPHTRLGLYLRLIAWGGFLVLSGALVGRLNEQSHSDFARLQDKILDWKRAQEELLRRVQSLERQNNALDGIRKKLETALYSAMDPWVAHMIVNKRLINEKRELTVLFADIVNFTAAVEDMDPEAVVQHTNRLFMELEPIIVAYNGHLDKFIGDGLMAEFGIPLLHPQNPLQAVLAALQVQKRVSSPDFRWKLRVGISHGEALVGLVGSQHRKSYTALGDVVNTAARLQKICPEGGVCVDGPTHDRIARWFNTRKLFEKETGHQQEILHARLAGLKEKIGDTRADYELLLEAARLSGELGEVPQAVEFYRKALEVNPQITERIEACVAELVMARPGREDRVKLRGKQKLVHSYEVLSLKDPLDDPKRIPAAVQAFGKDRFKSWGINRDVILPIEALDGRIGHGQITAAMAGSLAESMGLGEEVQRAAFEAGFYHDVGRRNVPEHLLNQDVLSALPEQDLQMIRVHVEAAALVLEDLGIKVSPAVAQAIEAHHENFDGTGYPMRLSGAAIPVAGRIIRVVDDYENHTSAKPHREGLAPAAALLEMKAGADRGVLDPTIVTALATMLRHGLQA
ncbi:MAG: HD domain-containing protein [Elusimicrobia bacterium]|nr:HD domain-containing protein [Elusimicrobiota bacterium]